MKKINFKKQVSTLLIAVSLANPVASFAHSGRTDSSGGHKDNKNKSGLGSYHYHCGGNPAHLHTNGCPYSTSAKKKSTSTKSSTSSKSTSSSASKEEMKKIQNKLNELGYDCGKADGVAGKKTKDAIKKFQKDKGLTADGVAGKKTKEKLGL